MQFIVIALVVAVPVQSCGPPTVILPSVVTLPLNPSNGAENDNAQAFCVTVSVVPINECSQCSVMFQLPLTSGHPLLPAPPALPLPALPGEFELSEPHALHTKPNTLNANQLRSIARWYR